GKRGELAGWLGWRAFATGFCPGARTPGGTAAIGCCVARSVVGAAASAGGFRGGREAPQDKAVVRTYSGEQPALPFPPLIPRMTLGPTAQSPWRSAMKRDTPVAGGAGPLLAAPSDL